MLDHERREIFDALEGLGEPPGEEELAEEVRSLFEAGVLRAGVDTSGAKIVPQYNWRGQKRTEMIGKYSTTLYEMKNVQLRFKSRQRRRRGGKNGGKSGDKKGEKEQGKRREGAEKEGKIGEKKGDLGESTSPYLSEGEEENPLGELEEVLTEEEKLQLKKAISEDVFSESENEDFGRKQGRKIKEIPETSGSNQEIKAKSTRTRSLSLGGDEEAICKKGGNLGGNGAKEPKETKNEREKRGFGKPPLGKPPKVPPKMSLEKETEGKLRRTKSEGKEQMEELMRGEKGENEKEKIELKEEGEVRKGLKPMLWLSKDFPLNLGEVLPLLELLSNKVKAVQRIKEVLQGTIPEGMVPVKVSQGSGTN